jgi:AmmeMemoRadiSam system protein A
VSVSNPPNMKDQISTRHGRRLLKLARQTIGHRLGQVESIDRSGLDDSELQRPLACFVTLKIEGRLRGCIGNLEATGPLLEALERNALQAAFHDHRFSQLSVDEFDRVRLDISILSRPEPLDYQNGDELLKLLQPGIDGIILQQGRARATFLPQVWEQLPEPQVFLEHLCLKAGLGRAAWRDRHPDIARYQVQSFSEEDHALDS